MADGDLVITSQSNHTVNAAIEPIPLPTSLPGVSVRYRYRVLTRTYAEMDAEANWTTPSTWTTTNETNFNFSHSVTGHQNVRFEIQAQYHETGNVNNATAWSQSGFSAQIIRRPIATAPVARIGLENGVYGASNVIVFRSTPQPVFYQITHNNLTNIAGWTLAIERSYVQTFIGAGFTSGTVDVGDWFSINSTSNPFNNSFSLTSNLERGRVDVRIRYIRVGERLDASGEFESPYAIRIFANQLLNVNQPSADIILRTQVDETRTFGWVAPSSGSGQAVQYRFRIQTRTYTQMDVNGPWVSPSAWTLEDSLEYVFIHGVVVHQQVRLEIQYRLYQTGNISNATDWSESAFSITIIRIPDAFDTRITIGLTTGSFSSNEIVVYSPNNEMIHYRATHTNNSEIAGWNLAFERNFRTTIIGDADEDKLMEAATINNSANPFEGSFALAPTYSRRRVEMRYLYRRPGGQNINVPNISTEPHATFGISPYARRMPVPSVVRFTSPSADIIHYTQIDEGNTFEWQEIPSHADTIREYRYRIQTRSYAQRDANGDWTSPNTWSTTTDLTYNFVHIAMSHQQCRMEIQSRYVNSANSALTTIWSESAYSPTVSRIPTAFNPTLTIGNTPLTFQSDNLTIYTPGDETIHYRAIHENNMEIAGWSLAFERDFIMVNTGGTPRPSDVSIVGTNANPFITTMVLTSSLESIAVRLRYLYRRSSNNVVAPTARWSDQVISPIATRMVTPGTIIFTQPSPSREYVITSQTNYNVSVEWLPVTPIAGANVQYRWRALTRTYTQMDNEIDFAIPSTWNVISNNSFQFTHGAAIHQQVKIEVQAMYIPVGQTTGGTSWGPSGFSQTIIRVPIAEDPIIKLGLNLASVGDENVLVYNPGNETLHYRISHNNLPVGEIAGWTLTYERRYRSTIPGSPMQTSAEFFVNDSRNPVDSTFTMAPALSQMNVIVRYLFRRANNQRTTPDASWSDWGESPNALRVSTPEARTFMQPSDEIIHRSQEHEETSIMWNELTEIEGSFAEYRYRVQTRTYDQMDANADWNSPSTWTILSFADFTFTHIVTQHQQVRIEVQARYVERNNLNGVSLWSESAFSHTIRREPNAMRPEEVLVGLTPTSFVSSDLSIYTPNQETIHTRTIQENSTEIAGWNLAYERQFQTSIAGEPLVDSDSYIANNNSNPLDTTFILATNYTRRRVQMRYMYRRAANRESVGISTWRDSPFVNRVAIPDTPVIVFPDEEIIITNQVNHPINVRWNPIPIMAQSSAEYRYRILHRTYIAMDSDSDWTPLGAWITTSSTSFIFTHNVAQHQNISIELQGRYVQTNNPNSGTAWSESAFSYRIIRIPELFDPVLTIGLTAGSYTSDDVSIYSSNTESVYYRSAQTNNGEIAGWTLAFEREYETSVANQPLVRDDSTIINNNSNPFESTFTLAPTYTRRRVWMRYLYRRGNNIIANHSDWIDSPFARRVDIPEARTFSQPTAEVVLYSQVNESRTVSWNPLASVNGAVSQYRWRVQTQTYTTMDADGDWTSSATWTLTDSTSINFTHNVATHQNARIEVQARYVNELNSNSGTDWSPSATSFNIRREPIAIAPKLLIGLSSVSFVDEDVTIFSSNSETIHYRSIQTNVAEIAGWTLSFERQFVTKLMDGNISTTESTFTNNSSNPFDSTFSFAPTYEERHVELRYVYRRASNSILAEPSDWSESKKAIRILVPPAPVFTFPNGDITYITQQNENEQFTWTPLSETDNYIGQYRLRVLTQTYSQMDAQAEWNVSGSWIPLNSNTYIFTHNVSVHQHVRLEVQSRYVQKLNLNNGTDWSESGFSVTMKREPWAFMPLLMIGHNNTTFTLDDLTIFNSSDENIHYRALHTNNPDIAGWTLAFERQVNTALLGSVSLIPGEATITSSNTSPFLSTMNLDSTLSRIQVQMRYLYQRNSGLTTTDPSEAWSEWDISPLAIRLATPDPRNFTSPPSPVILNSQENEDVLFRWQTLPEVDNMVARYRYRILTRSYDSMDANGDWTAPSTWTTVLDNEFNFTHNATTHQDVRVELQCQYYRSTNPNDSTSWSDSSFSYSITREPEAKAPTLRIGLSVASFGVDDILIYSPNAETIHYRAIHDNKPDIAGWTLSLERYFVTTIQGGTATNGERTIVSNNSNPFDATFSFASNYIERYVMVRYLYRRAGGTKTTEDTLWSAFGTSPSALRLTKPSPRVFLSPTDEIVHTSQINEITTFSWNPLDSVDLTSAEYQYRIQTRGYDAMDANSDSTWSNSSWIITPTTTFTFTHDVATHQQVRIEVQARYFQTSNINNRTEWSDISSSSSIRREPIAFNPSILLGLSATTLSVDDVTILNSLPTTFHYRSTHDNRNGVGQAGVNNNGNIAGWTLAFERYFITTPISGSPISSERLITNNGNNPHNDTFIMSPDTMEMSVVLRYLYRRAANSVTTDRDTHWSDEVISPLAIRDLTIPDPTLVGNIQHRIGSGSWTHEDISIDDVHEKTINVTWQFASQQAIGYTLEYRVRIQARDYGEVDWTPSDWSMIQTTLVGNYSYQYTRNTQDIRVEVDARHLTPYVNGEWFTFHSAIVDRFPTNLTYYNAVGNSRSNKANSNIVVNSHAWDDYFFGLRDSNFTSTFYDWQLQLPTLAGYEKFMEYEVSSGTQHQIPQPRPSVTMNGDDLFDMSNEFYIEWWSMLTNVRFWYVRLHDDVTPGFGNWITSPLVQRSIPTPVAPTLQTNDIFHVEEFYDTIADAIADISSFHRDEILIRTNLLRHISISVRGIPNLTQTSNGGTRDIYRLQMQFKKQRRPFNGRGGTGWTDMHSWSEILDDAFILNQEFNASDEEVRFVIRIRWIGIYFPSIVSNWSTEVVSPITRLAAIKWNNTGVKWDGTYIIHET